MAFLSRRRILLAMMMYEQFINFTQISLRPKIQLLSTLHHAYQSFLSVSLVLFRLQYFGTLCEHLHEHELQLFGYNMGKYFRPNVQISGRFFSIFAYKC